MSESFVTGTTAPKPAAAPAAGSVAALLVVDDLVKHYELPREHLLRAAPRVEALRGVSFAMHTGRSLGLVGESGSGKSTLARLVMALERADRRPRHAARPRPERAVARRAARRAARFPDGVPGPVRLARPAPARRPHRRRAARGDAGAPTRAQRVAESLDAVGLRASDVDKYPHEFSGGQRQRIAIARALITRPQADRRRRAGERARRLGAGAGAQPAAGPAGGSSASPTCSSATTSRWSTTCATRSRCCMPAASSSGARRRCCSVRRRIPTRGADGGGARPARAADAQWSAPRPRPLLEAGAHPTGPAADAPPEPAAGPPVKSPCRPPGRRLPVRGALPLSAAALPRGSPGAAGPCGRSPRRLPPRRSGARRRCCRRD